MCGYRYPLEDLALALAIKSTNQDYLMDHVHPPEILFYNCACQYSINLTECMEKLHPKLVPCIKELQMVIPHIHINNHFEDCMYLFCTVYMICMAHFYSKIAKHPWWESNEIRPMTCQINGGHCKEVLNSHNSNWN